MERQLVSTSHPRSSPMYRGRWSDDDVDGRAPEAIVRLLSEGGKPDRRRGLGTRLHHASHLSSAELVDDDRHDSSLITHSSHSLIFRQTVRLSRQHPPHRTAPHHRRPAIPPLLLLCFCFCVCFTLPLPFTSSSLLVLSLARSITSPASIHSHPLGVH